MFNGVVKVYLPGAIIRTLYDVVETENKIKSEKTRRVSLDMNTKN